METRKDETQVKGETVEVAKKIAAGIPPSNVEIKHVIDTTIAGIEEVKKEQPPMTMQEERVVEDFKNVLAATEQLVLEKNKEEALQKVIVHGVEAGATSVPAAAAIGLAGLPIGAMSVETQNMFSALNRLLWKLVQSPEFRADLRELFNILSDILFYDESGNLRTAAQPLREVLEGKKSVTEGVRESFEKAKVEVQQATTTTSTTSFGGGITPTFGEPLITLPETSTTSTPLGQPGYASGLPPVITETLPSSTSQVSGGRNDVLIDRLARLLTKLSSTEEYRTMVRELNNLITQLRYTWEKSTTTELAAKTVERDPHVLELRRNVRILIEQFAGHRSLEALNTHLNQLIDSVCDDYEVQQWVYDFRTLFREVIEHPERLNDPWFRNQCSNLIDRGRALANSYKWHNQWELVRSDVDTLINRISSDPLLVQFQSSLDQLVRDLTLDEYGRVSLNTAAIDRLRHMFVPLLLHHLREIPLPRVEESTNKLDYWLDNIFLSGEDITPERVTIKLKARTDIAPKQLETTYDRALLKIYVSDFAIHIPHLNYWFRRKTFPKVEDEGTATVDLIGRGVSAKIILSTEEAIGKKFFGIKKIEVDFSSVKLNIEESQHPVLMGLLTTLFKGRFKTLIETRMEKMLWNIIETINDRLVVAMAERSAQLSLSGVAGKVRSVLVNID